MSDGQCPEEPEEEDNELPSPIRIVGTVRRIYPPTVRTCCVTTDSDHELVELLYRQKLEADVRKINGHKLH